ncbi:MAG: hypothetical protein CMF82_03830 [Candidatus Marinimicrobia bacterium]|nr:hypothetical protein [Candidatus Neomarinimicrobiota bacterium]
MLTRLITIILVINALFWCFVPYEIQCELLNTYVYSKATKCLPFIVHITIGGSCFSLAVFIANYEYISKFVDLIMNRFDDILSLNKFG